MPHKRLGQICGFLMDVMHMYPGMTNYMIIYHLMSDSWRPHRDEEGWKPIGQARRINEELAKLEG
jgi:hypothetical protein